MFPGHNARCQEESKKLVAEFELRLEQAQEALDDDARPEALHLLGEATKAASRISRLRRSCPSMDMAYGSDDNKIEGSLKLIARKIRLAHGLAGLSSAKRQKRRKAHR